MNTFTKKAFLAMVIVGSVTPSVRAFDPVKTTLTFFGLGALIGYITTPADATSEETKENVISGGLIGSFAGLIVASMGTLPTSFAIAATSNPRFVRVVRTVPAVRVTPRIVVRI